MCERETLIGCLLFAPTLGPGPQPRMCPDRESNRQHFSSQAGAQSTEPHQPEPFLCSVCLSLGAP